MTRCPSGRSHFDTPADAQEWIIGCVGSTGTDAYISRRVSIEASVSSTRVPQNR